MEQKTMECSPCIMEKYEQWLREDEKEEQTIKKYTRDVKKFLKYLNNYKISKEKVISYKEHLKTCYTPISANSMIAAINKYLTFLGLAHCKVKQFKIQKKTYSDKELTKQEYIRLIKAGYSSQNERLSLLIQTIGSTGIRISELPFVTVEAIQLGRAEVSLKGKTRTVFLPKDLVRKLKKYQRKKGIESGPVFVTKSGKPMNRSNIWRELKKLCKSACVDASKVFPHNFRHLFARTFFGIEKDIVKLADILGHSSIETTRIYLMTTGAQHERLINRMGLLV